MCKRFALIFTYDGVQAVECAEYSVDVQNSVGWEKVVKLIGHECKYTESWKSTPILKFLNEKFGVEFYVNEDPIGKVNPHCKLLGCGMVDPRVERDILERKDPFWMNQLMIQKNEKIYGQIVCLSGKNAPYTDYLSLSGVKAICDHLKVEPEFVFLDESKKDEVCDGDCVHLRSFALRQECLCGYTKKDDVEIFACESCKAFRYCDNCSKEQERHKKLCVY